MRFVRVTLTVGVLLLMTLAMVGLVRDRHGNRMNIETINTMATLGSQIQLAFAEGYLSVEKLLEPKNSNVDCYNFVLTILRDHKLIDGKSQPDLVDAWGRRFKVFFDLKNENTVALHLMSSGRRLANSDDDIAQRYDISIPVSKAAAD